jgi:5-methylcytosine-specific restriction protein A
MDLASIKPGLVTTRAAMREVFGGGTQEGIIPSETTPNILIYVDHESGKKYGYEDGWLEEKDELGPVFEYTGQGTQGEQTFLGRRGSRNAAVLYHVDAARTLRVFMTAGKVPGSKSAAKQQRYIGEFELDSKQPYTLREANDEKGERRRIIVFRLRPTGDYERVDQDVITRAKTTNAYPVSVGVAATRLPEPKMVEPKRKQASESRRAAQPSLIADLRQSHLRDQYLKKLRKQEHEVFAYQIKIAGTTTILKTDLYDATEHELYSVRGESNREEVRRAIGQLKDYVRHIRPRNPKLSVVLPERPHDDLLNLLHTEGIDVVHQDDTGYVRCSAT